MINLKDPSKANVFLNVLNGQQKKAVNKVFNFIHSEKIVLN